VALPVFPSRFFRHSCIFIHVGSGIQRPEDLKGKKIGVPEYSITAAVLVRGFLKDDHGVRAQEIDWFVGGQEQPGYFDSKKPWAEVNDFLGGSGLLPANPPVDEGTFGGGYLRLTGTGKASWWVTADLLAGGEGRATGRLFGELRESLGGRRGVTLRLKGGLATRPTLQQALFRLGGINTVRGFDYGSLRGQAFWSAQLDLAPVSGRLRPVAFIDAGQAARPTDLFGSRALVGAGVGISMFSGLLRFDLSHPISPDMGGKLRFDIVVQAPR